MLISTSGHWAGGSNGQICKACRAGVWKCAQCPRETLLALLCLKTWFNHQLYFYHIRRHERPPQRAGPGKSSGGLWLLVIGCSVLWLTGPLLRLSSKLRLLTLSKVRTTLTDNGDIITARPGSLRFLCCPARGRTKPRTEITGLSSWIPSFATVCVLNFSCSLQARDAVSLPLLPLSGDREKWQRSGGPRARWVSRRMHSRWRRWSEPRRDAGRPERMRCLPATRTELMSLI